MMNWLRAAARGSADAWAFLVAWIAAHPGWTLAGWLASLVALAWLV